MRTELQVQSGSCKFEIGDRMARSALTGIRGSSIDQQYHSASLDLSILWRGSPLKCSMKGVAMQAHICYGSPRCVWHKLWGLNMLKQP